MVEFLQVMGVLLCFGLISGFFIFVVWFYFWLGDLKASLKALEQRYEWADSARRETEKRIRERITVMEGQIKARGADKDLNNYSK